jgi:peptidoglycan/xylan/chitin deacetylase (PgdA/CDA1 family)
MRKIAILIMLMVLVPLKASFAAAVPPPAGLPAPREGVVVLTYHHLEPASTGKHLTNSSVLPVEEFAWQMEYLHANNYYTMTMDEMSDFLAGRFTPPRRAVLLTFDDGYESNYTCAFPLLARYGFRSTIFLIGKNPGDEYGGTVSTVMEGSVPNRHLTTYQMKTMLRTGLMEFGCHTYDNHRYIDGKPALTVLGTEEIKGDLSRFDKIVVMVGIPVTFTIAYPYGAGSKNAVEAALSMGYRLGFTVNSGYVYPGDNTMFINRFSIHPTDSREYFTEVVSGGWQAQLKE